MAFQFRRNLYNEHSMEAKKRQEGLRKGGIAMGYDGTACCDRRNPLPAELQGKADYAIYRVHNNVAETMKANPGSDEEGFKVEDSLSSSFADEAQRASNQSPSCRDPDAICLRCDAIILFIRLIS